MCVYTVCIYTVYIPFFGFSFLPTVTDGVTCLVEPPATTELLAVLRTQYSRGFAKYRCIKYTKTECSSSQDDDDDENRLSAPTERDSERPMEI